MQRRVERRFQLRLGGGDSGTDANPIAEIGQHVRKSRYLRRGAHGALLPDPLDRRQAGTTDA